AASSSRTRAKRLTAVTSVAASCSSLSISASTRALIPPHPATAGFVGAVSETETVLIRARSVSFNPAGLRSTSRCDSRLTSTNTASTDVSFSATAFAFAARPCSWPSDPPASTESLCLSRRIRLTVALTLPSEAVKFELLAVALRRRGEARILHDRDLRGDRLRTQRHFHTVSARQHRRPGGRIPGLGQWFVARWGEPGVERLRSGILQLPHEPVEPGANRRALCHRQAAVVAAEARNRCTPLVIERERDRAGNALIQPVMDERAVWRILPDVQKFAIAGP